MTLSIGSFMTTTEDNNRRMRQELDEEREALGIARYVIEEDPLAGDITIRLSRYHQMENPNPVHNPLAGATVQVHAEGSACRPDPLLPRLLDVAIAGRAYRAARERCADPNTATVDDLIAREKTRADLWRALDAYDKALE